MDALLAESPTKLTTDAEDLTLSERLEQASNSRDPVRLPDGSVVIELEIHTLDSAFALPRPTPEQGRVAKLRSSIFSIGPSDETVRYITTRRG